jgi:hypothetical protein
VIIDSVVMGEPSRPVQERLSSGAKLQARRLSSVAAHAHGSSPAPAGSWVISAFRHQPVVRNRLRCQRGAPGSSHVSATISLHRSMHSSQICTPGPAMSFLTCF